MHFGTNLPHPVAGNHRNWDSGILRAPAYHREQHGGNDGGNLIFLINWNDADTTAYSPINLQDGPYVSGEIPVLLIRLRVMTELVPNSISPLQQSTGTT